MKVKDLKAALETLDDDVDVTLVTFDYSKGGKEFHLNFSCTQADDTKLRLTIGIDIDCARMKMHRKKAIVTTRKVEINGKVAVIADELLCGNCRCVLYGYDEIICPSCGHENDFEDTALVEGKVEDTYHDDFFGTYDNYEIDGVGFADPGGKSALRAATKDNPRNLSCPNCGEPNRLTPIDQQQGYQCDTCADQIEMGY